MSLQVLLCPGVDLVQSLVQVLHRIGNAESQVAFAKGAERRTCQARNPGIFQQNVGQFLGSPSGLGDIGEGIERAMRQTAAETGDLVQPGDKLVPPFVELIAHVLH
jgi:hypothetical protein